MNSISILKLKECTDNDIAEWWKNHKRIWSSNDGTVGKAVKIRRWFNAQHHGKQNCLIEVFSHKPNAIMEGYPAAFVLNTTTNIGYMIWDIDGLESFDIKDSLWDQRLDCYITV